MRLTSTLSCAALVVLFASRTAARAEDAPKTLAYAVVGAFGPGGASYPWHCAFSPDGKWVGFSDGHSSYVEVWDTKTGKRAWPAKALEAGGSHRIAFSVDSTRMAFVSEELRLLRLDRGTWREEKAIPLSVKPGISASWSPGRLDLAPDASVAVLTAAGRALRVDVSTSKVESLSGDAKDVVASFLFPGGGVAFSREGSFSTRFISAEGVVRDTPGVLLEVSSDNSRWLVGTDPKRFDLDFLEREKDSHLALEIRDSATGSALGSFVLSGKRKPGDSYGHRLLLQGQFSPDGRTLATVEGTGEIVLRDPTTGAPIQRILEYAHLPYPMGVAFSADGSRMITGGQRPFQTDFPNVLLWARAER